MTALNEAQYQLLKFWLPPLVAGAVAWFVFLALGETPLLRAAGLALVIVGMGLALRRMSTLVTLAGSLTLAFSPAFWSQTGGSMGGPATIVIALAAATVGVAVVVALSRRPKWGLAIGVGIFFVFFISQIGTPRSLRLTSFVFAWLLFLLLDMLLLTHPHPHDAPPLLRNRRKAGTGETPLSVQPYHLLGILLLFGVGVINDPLLVFLSPAIIISLLMIQRELPGWYWGTLMLIVGIGLRGFAGDYLQAQSMFMALHEWRYAERWIELIQLVNAQFGVLGVVLGILGLARFARWYPPVGIVTMVAYAAYAFFGLIYTGPGRDVLLLPLLIIQVMWMSYAVFTLGEWLHKALDGEHNRLNRLIWTIYGVVPLIMLWNIVSTG